MGFLNRFFRSLRKKAEKPADTDWEDLILEREEINLFDQDQCIRYVTNCMEQIAEASKEINQLNGEYALVTAYLTDMEEIEALPQDRKRELDKVARALDELEREKQKYTDKKDRMKDSDYYRMRKQENEIQEGIAKLKEAEHYHKLVQTDLKRLDREKNAYAYRKKELTTLQANLRGMAVIFVTALVACLAMLAILQFVFHMNTYVGYFITVLAGAIAITVVCVKYIDADHELVSLGKTTVKLIQLQNKVKIRYVNNTNLLEYLCLKYGAENAEQLEKRWANYREEKEQRQQFAEVEAKTEYYQKELLQLLSRYRVSDPGRWVNQVQAILDHREMVEIRHELILRRQALRQQLEYNNQVAQNARDEVMHVAQQYSQYRAEIMELVDRYDKGWKSIRCENWVLSF